MFSSSSTIKIDLGKIKELNRAAIRALEMTAEALHTEVVQAQVIPRDTGNLQNESFSIDKDAASDGEIAFIHNAVYARRMYYHPEYHFSKDENANAKGHWYEDWLSGGADDDFAQRAFSSFYKDLTGV